MVDAPNIIQSQGDAPDPLRGRDVAFALQKVDCDPQLKALIIQLAERCYMVTKSVAELATMFDQMIDTMNGFGNVAENLKKRTDDMMRSADDQEQLPDEPR